MSVSTNTSSAAAVNEINQRVTIFIQIWCISVFVLGAIGQTLNLYVFTRRRFRSNPCTCYFLASTVANYGIIYGTLPLRLLQTAYNIDIFVYSLPACQILSYLLNCFRVLSPWFIALALLDRYFCSSTSANVRRWSSIRIAWRIIPLTVLFIGLVYIHMPFNYTILLPQNACSFASNAYGSFFSIWNLVFFSWIPSLSMLIFGLLTIRHVRQVKMRVVPLNNLQKNQIKIDRQLIQMVIIQSFVFGATTTPYSICQLYVSITSKMMKINDLDKAKYSYLTTVSNWISLVGPCLSFYLFTLSSKMFRRELIDLFNRVRPTQQHINANPAATQGRN